MRLLLLTLLAFLSCRSDSSCLKDEEVDADRTFLLQVSLTSKHGSNRSATQQEQGDEGSDDQLVSLAERRRAEVALQGAPSRLAMVQSQGVAEMGTEDHLAVEAEKKRKAVTMQSQPPEASAMMQVQGALAPPPVVAGPQKDTPAGKEQEDHFNGICDVTFKEGHDCEMWTHDDSYKKLNSFTWQSRICKSPFALPTCLWQGCVANGNLKQGAQWYMEWKSHTEDIPYCFKEHCGNTEFTLDGTTLDDANNYCTKKFGEKWKDMSVGPNGMGWDGQGMGSGLWECAHANYHCDWAYCKLYFCDVPELREQYCNEASGNACAPELSLTQAEREFIR